MDYKISVADANLETEAPDSPVVEEDSSNSLRPDYPPQSQLEELLLFCARKVKVWTDNGENVVCKASRDSPTEFLIRKFSNVVDVKEILGHVSSHLVRQTGDVVLMSQLQRCFPEQTDTVSTSGWGYYAAIKLRSIQLSTKYQLKEKERVYCQHKGCISKGKTIGIPSPNSQAKSKGAWKGKFEHQLKQHIESHLGYHLYHCTLCETPLKMFSGIRHFKSIHKMSLVEATQKEVLKDQTSEYEMKLFELLDRCFPLDEKVFKKNTSSDDATQVDENATEIQMGEEGVLPSEMSSATSSQENVQQEGTSGSPEVEKDKTGQTQETDMGQIDQVEQEQPQVHKTTTEASIGNESLSELNLMLEESGTSSILEEDDKSNTMGTAIKETENLPHMVAFPTSNPDTTHQQDSIMTEAGTSDEVKNKRTKELKETGRTLRTERMMAFCNKKIQLWVENGLNVVCDACIDNPKFTFRKAQGIDEDKLKDHLRFHFEGNNFEEVMLGLLKICFLTQFKQETREKWGFHEQTRKRCLMFVEKGATGVTGMRKKIYCQHPKCSRKIFPLIVRLPNQIKPMDTSIKSHVEFHLGHRMFRCVPCKQSVKPYSLSGHYKAIHSTTLPNAKQIGLLKDLSPKYEVKLFELLDVCFPADERVYKDPTPPTPKHEIPAANTTTTPIESSNAPPQEEPMEVECESSPECNSENLNSTEILDRINQGEQMESNSTQPAGQQTDVPNPESPSLVVQLGDLSIMGGKETPTSILVKKKAKKTVRFVDTPGPSDTETLTKSQQKRQKFLRKRKELMQMENEILKSKQQKLDPQKPVRICKRRLLKSGSEKATKESRPKRGSKAMAQSKEVCEPQKGQDLWLCQHPNCADKDVSMKTREESFTHTVSHLDVQVYYCTLCQWGFNSSVRDHLLLNKTKHREHTAEFAVNNGIVQSEVPKYQTELTDLYSTCFPDPSTESLTSDTRKRNFGKVSSSPLLKGSKSCLERRGLRELSVVIREKERVLAECQEGTRRRKRFVPQHRDSMINKWMYLTS